MADSKDSADQGGRFGMDCRAMDVTDAAAGAGFSRCSASPLCTEMETPPKAFY